MPKIREPKTLYEFLKLYSISQAMLARRMKMPVSTFRLKLYGKHGMYFTNEETKKVLDLLQELGAQISTFAIVEETILLTQQSKENGTTK